MSCATEGVARICSRRGVVGLALVFVLGGCTGSGDPRVAPEATGGEHATVQSGVSGTPDQAPDDVDLEPDLYLIDPATGGTEPILFAMRGLHEPERSPDGSQLAYQGATPAGTPQIFLFDDGTRRQLTHFPGGAVEPTWSPDGSQIAFAARTRAGAEGRNHTDIFVMDSDGGHVRRLVGTRWGRRPDWSPDGSRVVFDTYGAISVASVLDGELTRLTSYGDITHRHGPAADPTWSPDGRWIAVTRFDIGSINGVVPSAHLWIMRSDGTGERRLIAGNLHGVYELDPSWSPDGNSIAFSALVGVGVGRPDVSSGRVGIVDVQTRDVTYLSTSHVAGLSWGTEGIVASRGDGVRNDPTFTLDRDPWFDG